MTTYCLENLIASAKVGKLSGIAVPSGLYEEEVLNILKYGYSIKEVATSFNHSIKVFIKKEEK